MNINIERGCSIKKLIKCLCWCANPLAPAEAILFYMDADLQGCLNQLDRSYKAFEHNGQPMYKHQVKAILEYGLVKGYKALSEISDEETEKILLRLENSEAKEEVIPPNQLDLF